MNAPSPFETIPSSRNERWQLLREVIADWFAPLSSNDGYANLVSPIDLPLALREWYQLCGKRADIWSRQDHRYSPSDLRLQNEYLTIIVENQACAYWGIPLAQIHTDDPPVFVDMSGEWVCENTTTSEFALQLLAFNIKWSDGICWANGCGDKSAHELIRQSYARFAFPDWNWPVNPTRFYGTRDLIIETNGDVDDIWFWIAARTESAFQDLNKLIEPTGMRWEAEKLSTK